MSGRDLLYKPPTPAKPPDDDDEARAKRVGTKGPKGREIGRVGEIYESKAPRSPPGTGAEPDPSEAPRPQQGRPPAFRNPYFNTDVGAVKQPNPRASGMRALRGERDVTDLRKVVLPPSPSGIEQPSPSVLREATDLMGMAEAFRQSLRGLIDRQGEWARGEGVTPEMLRQRLARLEQMVEDRREALKRLAALSGDRLAQSATLTQAVCAGGAALEQTTDVSAEGTDLIERVGERAQPMHVRLAKALGHKMG